MPRPRRRRVQPTEDWSQLRLLVHFPEQRACELLRPVALFGQSPAERARRTATPQGTLYRRADRFDKEGMASLFAPPKAEGRSAPPEKIRVAILELGAEYPLFRAHEIKTICLRGRTHHRFGHSLSHHTVKRVLAEGPLPGRAKRRFEPYHRIPDACDRRHAIVSSHAEGWNVKTIAAHLETSRQTVCSTLGRWIEEGAAGLDDKSRARKDVRETDSGQ